MTIFQKKSVVLIAVTGLALTQFGCATMQGGQTSGDMSRTQKGAIIGGLGGAVVGGLIGSKKGNAGKGALIGGVLGAATGGVIGNYMDKQAQELAQVADVQRVDDGIVATMKDKILFDFNESSLKPEAKANLQKMAAILKKYDKTEMTVAGYTDNVGTMKYNQQLSERRASAVRNYLVEQGVSSGRMTVMGFGPDNPVASNDTPEGRAQNRRVELHISPNNQLVKEAQQPG
ncbi:MAG: OmpA family protein [Pseudomonadota bacterium]